MELVNRVAMLVDLISHCGGSISGRKKLHKIVYLLQQAGEDFGQEFNYHLYGVYSSGLAGDLRYMRNSGLLSETEFPVGEFVEFILQTPEDKPTVGSSFRIKTTLELVKDISGRSARDLEVLSTLVYLRSKGIDDNRLEPQLRELKGAIIDESRLPELMQLCKRFPAH